MTLRRGASEAGGGGGGGADHHGPGAAPIVERGFGDVGGHGRVAFSGGPPAPRGHQRAPRARQDAQAPHGDLPRAQR